MKIEEGKWYERRDGKIVGPAEKWRSEWAHHFPWKLGEYLYPDNARVPNANKQYALIREVPAPDDNEWREVAQVGWPEKEDYPVWIAHPSGKVGYCMDGYEDDDERLRPCSVSGDEAETSRLYYLSSQKDKETTHWKRAPRLVAPEPPKTDKRQERIEAALAKICTAKEAVRQAEAELEKARDER